MLVDPYTLIFFHVKIQKKVFFVDFIRLIIIIIIIMIKSEKKILFIVIYIYKFYKD